MIRNSFPGYRLAIMYAAMVAAGIDLFLLISSYGSTLESAQAAPPGHEVSPPAAVKPDALVHVLVALTAVLVVGRLVAWLFRYVGQPPVIGEVVGGILLGPSLLGRVWPAAEAFIFPPSVAPFLAVIAQVGVILYMFVVGLQLNTGLLRQRAGAAVAISHASILVPFLLGAALAIILYPRLSSRDVSFTSFALFVGVAMAITAFPVLARILTDRQMEHTRLGVMALTCAAADDVTAWCLLAFVVGVAQAQVAGAIIVSCMALVFIVFMFLAVRPMALRLADGFDEARLSPDVIAVVFALLLLCALATEAIGIHAIFGAFLLGSVIPRESALAQALVHKLQDLVTVLLLPAFFAMTGMRTEIGLVAGAGQWALCGLIIVVATLGKFGGTFMAARLAGLAWREAGSLGVLMNTRGLMELVVLNIGLDLRIISPTLFAMMVLMALVTTIATTPILSILAAGTTKAADGQVLVSDAPEG
jgi:Kef-type K+ transport system membrane component KefB